jgi:hypothetical protein
VTAHEGAFEESSATGVFDWKGPNDAHQQLNVLRESWTIARNDLEHAMRDVNREASIQSPPPCD